MPHSAFNKSASFAGNGNNRVVVRLEKKSENHIGSRNSSPSSRVRTRDQTSQNIVKSLDNIPDSQPMNDDI